MKPEISEQSKNEVEVLLENYVVSPPARGNFQENDELGSEY